MQFMRSLVVRGILLGAFLILPVMAQAGGAFSTTPQGDPVLWSGPVTFRMDPGGSETLDSGGDSGAGGCSLLPKAQAAELKNFDVTQMVRNAFNTWAAQTDGLTIQEGPALPEDVNFSNVENYYVGSFLVDPFVSTVTADPCYTGNGDCLNSVIFDPNGLIIDALVGQCARYQIYALASIIPQTLSDSQNTIASKDLKAAQMVISGACVTPADASDPSCSNSQFGSTCAQQLDSQGLQGVILHEAGHFIGLDHTLVAKDEFFNCLKGGTCTAEDMEKIPTMVGTKIPGLNETTLTQDDISTVRGFYPDSGSSTCSITGIVQTLSGANGRCVEVVARKQGDPSYAVGSVSGAYVPRNSQGLSCPAGNTSNQCSGLNNASSTYKVPANCTLAPESCGTFQIDGLEPGTYEISLQTLQDNSGTGVPFVLEPCIPARTGLDLVDKKQAATETLATCPLTKTILTPLKLN